MKATPDEAKDSAALYKVTDNLEFLLHGFIDKMHDKLKLAKNEGKRKEIISIAKNKLKEIKKDLKG